MDPEHLGALGINENSFDGNVCSLCHEEPIGWTFPQATFRFDCGHAFCVDCVMERIEFELSNTS